MITYSSLISACEKAGDWKLALEFFEECTKDNCRPNVITFNSLITACAQGARSNCLVNGALLYQLPDHLVRPGCGAACLGVAFYSIISLITACVQGAHSLLSNRRSTLSSP